MSTVRENHYRLDLPWISRHAGAIRAAASRHGVPASVLAAVMSRESGGGRLLKPQGPGGTGDAGHGHGLMQIDDRSHEFARSGPWQDPAANIDYAARLLAGHLKTAGRKGLKGRDAFRLALAAYNSGMGNAWPSYRDHGDPDLRTAGHNYSYDVLERAKLFARDFPNGPGMEFLAPLIGAIMALWL